MHLKQRFENLLLVWPYFSRYLSTCTYLSLLSSCIIFQIKACSHSSQFLHVHETISSSFLMFFGSVLDLGSLSQNEPVSCIKNVGPKCGAHLQCTWWSHCPLDYPHFLIPHQILFCHRRFPSVRRAASLPSKVQCRHCVLLLQADGLETTYVI